MQQLSSSVSSWINSFSTCRLHQAAQDQATQARAQPIQEHLMPNFRANLNQASPVSSVKRKQLSLNLNLSDLNQLNQLN